MAKLSARGRRELARYAREYNKPNEGKPYDVCRERQMYACMSDGNVLVQLKCWWNDGQAHLYNWKVVKLRDCYKGVVNFEALYKHLESKGYTRVEH